MKKFLFWIVFTLAAAALVNAAQSPEQQARDFVFSLHDNGDVGPALKGLFVGIADVCGASGTCTRDRDRDEPTAARVWAHPIFPIFEEGRHRAGVDTPHPCIGHSQRTDILGNCILPKRPESG